MGIEYEGIKLTDVYNKANPNKIAQKYGKSILISLAVNHQGEPTVHRNVKINPNCPSSNSTAEEELEEEKLLDEQKLF